MKLFVYNLRHYDEKEYFDLYTKKYGCTYDYTPEYPTRENAHLAEGYEALSIITSPIDAQLMQLFHAGGVRYISTRTIGYDHIDLSAAKKLDIQVAHVNYSPNSVANYTIMLMLMACRNIPHILNRSNVQDFTLKGKIGREISNCTIGIIGTGRIGTTVIEHLSGFGSQLLAYDTYENPSVKKVAKYTDLDTLMRTSDIISLHAPATEGTYHLIDDQAISQMKDDVILINTARGALVDTQALIQALDAGKIGFAALDVLEHESGLYYFNRMNEVIGNHELAILSSYPNVLLTPHTAFYTDEAVSNMVEYSIEGLHNFKYKKENRFKVDLESY